MKPSHIFVTSPALLEDFHRMAERAYDRKGIAEVIHLHRSGEPCNDKCHLWPAHPGQPAA